jgi:hypothetical protein
MRRLRRSPRELRVHADSITSRSSRASTLVVWRCGFVVRHRAAGAGEARALRALERGVDLVALCDAFAEEDDAIDAVAERVSSALRQWVVDGVLAARGFVARPG